MAKAARTANEQSQTISEPVQDNATILDIIDNGEKESTIEDLNNSGNTITQEPSMQEPITVQEQPRVTVQQNQTKEVFIPTEEALPVSEQMAKPATRQTVVLKLVSQSKFRLGLENTPERFIVMPGTVQRWAPKKVGNLYRTGLNRPELAPTEAERKQRITELEYHFGKKLDNEFYANLSFRIDCNKPLGEKLYLDRPEDLVVYLAMLESDSVANGIHEYQNGIKPFAIYYIEDKEAEAEADAKERNDKIKATALFQEISYIKKRKIAVILGLDVFGLSDAAMENVLWKWLESKVANARLFVQLVGRGDTYINISEMVRNAVRFNVLRRIGTDFFYGDNLIGTSEAQIVDKLMSTQYSDLRLGIQSKVEVKLNQI